MAEIVKCKECEAHIPPGHEMTWTNPDEPGVSIVLCTICFDARDARVRAEAKQREEQGE